MISKRTLRFSPPIVYCQATSSIGLIATISNTLDQPQTSPVPSNSNRDLLSTALKKKDIIYVLCRLYVEKLYHGSATPCGLIAREAELPKRVARSFK